MLNSIERDRYNQLLREEKRQNKALSDALKTTRLMLEIALKDRFGNEGLQEIQKSRKAKEKEREEEMKIQDAPSP